MFGDVPIGKKKPFKTIKCRFGNGNKNEFFANGLAYGFCQKLEILKLFLF